MTVLLTPHEVETRAKANGRSIADICRDAGIAQSTFSRWKRNKNSPSIDVYQRIVAAIEPKPRHDLERAA